MSLFHNPPPPATPLRNQGGQTGHVCHGLDYVLSLALHFTRGPLRATMPDVAWDEIEFDTPNLLVCLQA